MGSKFFYFQLLKDLKVQIIILSRAPKMSKTDLILSLHPPLVGIINYLLVNKI